MRCTNVRVRCSDAPLGSCAAATKNPLSSVGRNPVGTWRYSTTISATITAKIARKRARPADDPRHTVGVPSRGCDRRSC